MIHFGVVEAGQQMGRPRPAGRKADTQLAGKLGVTSRHKGRHLFVPHLNKFNAVALLIGALDGTEHTVNAVAGIAVNTGYAPGF